MRQKTMTATLFIMLSPLIRILLNIMKAALAMDMALKA